MTRTLNKSRHNPKYKINVTNNNTRTNLPTPLPINLQNFKNKLLSGNGFFICR